MSSFWIWHSLRVPLFKPPFDFQQRIHMWIESFRWAVAFTRVQVRPAVGTQTFAVYRAKRLHRKGQQNLFAQDIGDGQSRTAKERRPRIRFLEFDFFVFVEQVFVALAEEEIKRLL